MRIEFANRKIKRLCDSSSYPTKKLGKKCGEMLQRRLADLQAARSMIELLCGHPHPLNGNRKGQFAIRLLGKYRLIIEPILNYKVSSGESISLKDIDTIVIVDVVDYH